MRIVPKYELLARLATFQESNKLTGLATKESRTRLVEKLFDSEKQLRALSMRRFVGSTDTARPDFHPLKMILDRFARGDRDEAIWLAFLTIHFGLDARETVRLFYCKFGAGRLNWEAARGALDSLRCWMRENGDRLKKLKFGNHRKRRTMNPDHARGTWNVIRSFVNWVELHGNGSPYRAAQRHLAHPQMQKGGFDQFYQGLDILDFGRTAKFDFLCLLGNLHIFDITPRHCYLKGATGPKDGALLMVTGRKKGRLHPIESTIKKLTQHLGVSVEAMEDALCNWQKRPKGKKFATQEQGYLTCACQECGFP